MDTTSHTLSRILHHLSQNPDIQTELRQELIEAHAANGLSYDDLNRLPILDSVCRETLRRSVARRLIPSRQHPVQRVRPFHLNSA